MLNYFDTDKVSRYINPQFVLSSKTTLVLYVPAGFNQHFMVRA